jgi:AcrR family transcriptional regulator
VTPQQHKQHLLALADELETTARPGGLGQRAAEAIRDFAARLTPGVSDAVRCALADTLRIDLTDEQFSRLSTALEAVFPLVDDGQAKDAARWREVLHRFDAQKTSACERIMADLGFSHSVALDLTSAIDAALAAPPKGHNTMNRERECSSCGALHDEPLFIACPFCGAEKCPTCDMGNDTVCIICEGDNDAD